jgi:hypothetical protein
MSLTGNDLVEIWQVFPDIGRWIEVDGENTRFRKWKLPFREPLEAVRVSRQPGTCLEATGVTLMVCALFSTARVDPSRRECRLTALFVLCSCLKFKPSLPR